MHAGLYFPGILREGVGEVVIAVDCSGSISNRILALFQTEVGSIVQENQPSRVHPILREIIHRVDTFENERIYHHQAPGRRHKLRTDLRVCVHEQNIMPHTLIVLTDLEGKFPDAEPPYPVISASTVRYTSPSKYVAQDSHARFAAGSE
jgi:predicted metal-dependent peptidase